MHPDFPDPEPSPSPPASPPRPGPDEATEQIRRMSRRGFAIAGATALAGGAGLRWLATRGLDQGTPWPLRRVLDLNEGIARATFRPARLAPVFPASAIQEPRANGPIGLGGEVDPAAWRLSVVGPAGPAAGRSFGLDEIRALPRHEMITELKCIEGWSRVVRWAGARLSDLAALSGLATRSGQPPDPLARPRDLWEYAALETPDGSYYVGLDMPSALHPQALLAYEMNGAPLTRAHGAPLRLAIPVKYGIKNLKRVGTIRFSDARPADYWAERGYDWYAGH